MGKTEIRMQVRTVEFKGRHFRGRGTAEIILSCTLRDGRLHEIRDTCEAEGTQNQLAAAAVVRGLKHTLKPCRITLVTDNEYVRRILTDGSLERWEKEGFLQRGKERPNAKELRQLLMASRIHEITCEPEEKARAGQDAAM